MQTQTPTEGRLSATEIDGRGRSISTAILYELVSVLRDLAPGGRCTIVTDALPAVDSDIRAWCRTTGHELVGTEEDGTERRYTIVKAERPRVGPSWALVISDAGLEELLSPLGFALAAALGGRRVSLYFQGPAVRVLTKSFKERLKGWHRAPFSRFARRGLERAGHPSPHQKLWQLSELGAQLYICGPSMEHFKVNREDLLFGDAAIAAYPSFVEEMEKAGVQIYLP